MVRFRQTSILALTALATLAGKPQATWAFHRVAAVIPSNPEDAITRLANSAIPVDERLDAARELVRLSDTLSIRDEIAVALSSPLTKDSPADLLLRAISESPRVSMRLFQPIAARLSTSTTADMPSVLHALGRFKTRESVRLISLHIRHPDPQVARSAMDALVDISGRDDLPRSPNAWIAWSARVGELTELQWQSELIDSLVTRSDRLFSERQVGVNRLSAALRQLYLATDPVQRSSLLSEWIADPIDEVRDLGIELARRELGSSTKLDPSVGAAALKLLNSDVPSVRARAAVLVRQLAPEGAASAVSQSLASENDPEAASTLLLAASRWPDKTLVPASLNWLARHSIARDSAIEACNALARAAMMNAQERERSLGLAREMLNTSPTAALVGLLWTLGDSTDADSIAPFLKSESSAIRIAAADALLWSEVHAPLVIDAANVHDDLFDAASKAAMVHFPDAAGFAIIAKLPTRSRDIRDAALVRLGRALSADALESALSELEDGPAARALWFNLVSRERLLSESDVPGALAAICRAMVRLSEADLKAGRPDSVLTRLEPMPTNAPSDSLDAAQRLRLLSCIALGRLELAEQDPKADLQLWISSLDLIVGKEHEEETIRRIESRFGDRIDEASAAAISAAKARIAKSRAPQ